MLLHPHLWPAMLGALAGFALIAWVSFEISRRWDKTAPRKRWVWVIALGVFEIAFGLNVYAWLIEPQRLIVRHVEIVSADWHGAPLTIAAIADTHVGGPHVDAARVGRVVRRINALAPDIVVLLGDYVGGHAPQAARTPAEQQEVSGGIAAFAALNARLGVIAVLGNHDSWYNRQTITAALQDAGIATLWNRNVEIDRPAGGSFVVVGLADLDTGAPSYAEAMDGAPAGADILVLSHSPDPFVTLPRGPALTLAAHSHCGQVTIPFVGRPFLPIRNKRYACHLVEENGRIMYVTGGIGTSIVPVRFLNPPEIVMITLRAAAPS